MMTEEHIKEAISLRYIELVAAYNGYKSSSASPDYGTDLDIKEVDLETTVRMIKRRIIEKRRDNNISWGTAREFWDNIADVFSGTQDEYYIRSQMVELEGFDDIFGDSGCIPIQYKMKQIYINFWEELWVPFVAALEKSDENP